MSGLTVEPDDEGGHRLPPLGRRHPDDGDLSDRWVAGQDGLDLGRIHVVPPVMMSSVRRPRMEM